MRGKLLRIALLALLAALWSPVSLRAQCSMCWSTLTHSSEGLILARGFNSGILFLITVPFLVTGALAFFVYQAMNNKPPISVQPEVPHSQSREGYSPRVELELPGVRS